MKTSAADPLRRKVLIALMQIESGLTVQEIADRADMSLPAVRSALLNWAEKNGHARFDTSANVWRITKAGAALIERAKQAAVPIAADEHPVPVVAGSVTHLLPPADIAQGVRRLVDDDLRAAIAENERLTAENERMKEEWLEMRRELASCREGNADLIRQRDSYSEQIGLLNASIERLTAERKESLRTTAGLLASARCMAEAAHHLDEIGRGGDAAGIMRELRDVLRA